VHEVVETPAPHAAAERHVVTSVAPRDVGAAAMRVVLGGAELRVAEAGEAVAEH
jgi:hypothetical protein